MRRPFPGTLPCFFLFFLFHRFWYSSKLGGTTNHQPAESWEEHGLCGESRKPSVLFPESGGSMCGQQGLARHRQSGDLRGLCLSELIVLIELEFCLTADASP